MSAINNNNGIIGLKIKAIYSVIVDKNRQNGLIYNCNYVKNRQNGGKNGERKRTFTESEPV